MANVTLQIGTEQTGAIETTGGTIDFIGNATVLIRYAGFTILTDPNFLHEGEDAHLGYGLTSRRLTNPAREIADLPPIDLVVLSHLHGDHWDYVAEEQLPKDTLILAPPSAARTLRSRDFEEARGLATWETATIQKGQSRLRVTAMPGKHAPGPLKFLLPPMMGSMLEFEHGGMGTLQRIYISGDTLLDESLRAIPRRYHEIDIGLFHLGGTRVMGVTVTMDGEQGAQAVRLIAPLTAIPIHYDDYAAFKSTLTDFVEAAERSGLEDRIVLLRRGERYTFEAGEGAPVDLGAEASEN